MAVIVGLGTGAIHAHSFGRIRRAVAHEDVRLVASVVWHQVGGE
jgi:hypothetical protein